MLLSAAVQGGRPIFVCSDGNVSPLATSRANVFLTVDGKKVSNDTTVDWEKSLAPVQHSFRAMAVLNPGPGAHTIAVVADGTKAFLVGAGTNLSIMPRPADHVQSDALKADSATIVLNTHALRNGVDSLPAVPVAALNLNVESSDPIVLLASGTSYFTGTGEKDFGDAMWGLWTDGVEMDANHGTYADNDMCFAAELQAPMFVQGFWEGLAHGSHRAELRAGAEPWPPDLPPDPAHFRVREGTCLVALRGGMKVAGHAVEVNQAQEPVVLNRTAFRCIASSRGWNGAPEINTDVVIGTGTVDVPAGHNGVVFISAMTRPQGDWHDRGGKFEMWLTVDGVRRGSTGLQQLAQPSTVSTRTTSVSFLAAGKDALSPGRHLVQLHVRATGDFIHLAISKNMPVMWFD